MFADDTNYLPGYYWENRYYDEFTVTLVNEQIKISGTIPQITFNGDKNMILSGSGNQDANILCRGTHTSTTWQTNSTACTLNGSIKVTGKTASNTITLTGVESGGQAKINYRYVTQYSFSFYGINANGYIDFTYQSNVTPIDAVHRKVVTPGGLIQHMNTNGNQMTIRIRPSEPSSIVTIEFYEYFTTADTLRTDRTITGVSMTSYMYEDNAPKSILEYLKNNNDNGGFSDASSELQSTSNTSLDTINSQESSFTTGINSIKNGEPTGLITIPGFFGTESWNINLDIWKQNFPQVYNLIHGAVLVVLSFGAYNMIKGAIFGEENGE